MNLGIIIQARLGSTRFPGKIAAKINPDQNILESIALPVSRLQLKTVIAFPDTPEHRSFAQTLQVGDVDFFFGEEYDVLGRFVQAARHFGFSSVVRVCGDNPCLNMAFLSQLISQWSEDYDYLAFFDSKGTPATKTHYGLFSEIAKVSALERIREATHEKYYTEHVTPYFYEHPSRFNIGRINMPEPFWSGAPLRFTVDTEADFKMIRDIISRVNVQDVKALVEFCDQESIRSSMQHEIAQNSK